MPKATGYVRLAVIAEIACHGLKAPVQAHLVARSIGASTTSVEKACADLIRRGLIKGFRGPGGGHMLAKPAEDILLPDIIDSVSTGGSGKQYSGSDSRIVANTLCLWEQSDNLLIEVYRHISLADIVHGDLKLHPFLKRIRDFCSQSAKQRRSVN